MQFTIGLLNFPTYSCVQLAFEISVSLALNYTLKSDAVFQPMTVNCQQALFAGCPLSCQQMIHNVICSISKFYLLVHYYCNLLLYNTVIEFQGKLFIFLQDRCMPSWREMFPSAQQADVQSDHYVTESLFEPTECHAGCRQIIK